ncbi:unnamed protein product [Notodromas monacha]|uniref:UBA domain-containing protein n=1 Tax=Notodromas monacha TaxID=399045 RepID=A0A7R9G7L0_9CRUS|nr:unnamed protein product [Notodromas monacha]CAG0912350.1 unnamed protein product [Notodromas monacha]
MRETETRSTLLFQNSFNVSGRSVLSSRDIQFLSSGINILCENFCEFRMLCPSMSFLDGIGIKIAEEWKPAGRVELPKSLLMKLDIRHTKNDEYNFTLERNTLALVRNRREKQRLEAEALAARLLAQSTHVDAEDRVTSTTVPPAQAQLPKLFPVSAPTAEVAVDRARRDSITGVCPLLPETTALPSAGVVSDSPWKRSEVNLKEFEADAGSPFDQMELKTLNDVQELASVLQNAQVSASAKNADVARHVPIPPTQDLTNLSSGYYVPYPSVVTTSGYLPTSLSGFYPTRPMNSVVAWPQVASNWRGNYMGGPFPPALDGKQSLNYPSVQYWNHPTTIGSVPTEADAARSMDERGSGNRSSSLPRQSCTNLTKAMSVSVPNLATEQEAFSGSPSMPRIDQSWCKSSPLVQQMSNLRLHAQILVFQKYTIKTGNRSEQRSRTPPPIPTPTRTKFPLPDIFSQLNFEGKKKVTHISEMGFPRDRVARCFQHMKGDEKKIIEHLLLIQTLEDKGHPGDWVEVAATDLPAGIEDSKTRRSSFDDKSRGNDSKIMACFTQRLTLMAQFSDLGFPIKHIVMCLRDAGWEKDRALDALLK